MSSGSDALELLDTGTLENFEEMSIEQFIQWSNTQVGEGFFPWSAVVAGTSSLKTISSLL